MKRYQKYALVIVVNLILFVTGLGIILSTAKGSETKYIAANKVNVTIDQNLSENNLVIINLLTADRQTVTVIPEFLEQETRLALFPGVYELNYFEAGNIKKAKLEVLPGQDTKLSLTSVLPSAAPDSYKAQIEFVNPMSGCVEYSYQRGFQPWHTGVDLAVTDDCVVSAAADAKVITASWNSNGAGFQVVLDHGDGYTSSYMHGNGTFFVKSGDAIKAGQKIMMAGCSGNCVGKHLHFEIAKSGEKLDPSKFIKF